MRVEVKPVNVKGKPVPAKERKAAPTYSGMLRLHEVRSHELGRMTPTAFLLSVTDSAELSLLPQLQDAAVLYVHDGRMRVRGFEVVDGIQYGQTWDVTVAAC
jgi:hypothetical protein